MPSKGKSDQTIKPLLNLKPKFSDEAELKDFCEKNCELIAPGTPILPRINVEGNQKETVEGIQNLKGILFPRKMLFPFFPPQWVKPRAKNVAKVSQKKKDSKRKGPEKEPAHSKRKKNSKKDGDLTLEGNNENPDKGVSKVLGDHCTMNNIGPRKSPQRSESHPSYSGQKNLHKESPKNDPAQSKAEIKHASTRSCVQCCQVSRDHMPCKRILNTDYQSCTINMSPVAGNMNPGWKGDGNSPSFSCRPAVDVLAPYTEYLWPGSPYGAHTTVPFSAHEQFSPCPCCQYPPSVPPMPMTPFYYREPLFTNQWPTLNESLHTQKQYSTMVGPYHSLSESQHGFYWPATATSPLPFDDKMNSYSFHPQQHHHGASCSCFHCHQTGLMCNSTAATHTEPVFSSPVV